MEGSRTSTYQLKIDKGEINLFAKYKQQHTYCIDMCSLIHYQQIVFHIQSIFLTVWYKPAPAHVK